MDIPVTLNNVKMVKDYKEVIKRDGSYERLDTNKIQKRLDSLKNEPEINRRYGELTGIDTYDIALRTEKDVYNGITTTELDDATARIMQPMGIDNPDYIDMAGRVLINSSQKNSLHYLYALFPDVPKEKINANITLYTYEALYANVAANGRSAPLVAPQFLGLVRGNYEWLERIIDYYKDYSYGFEAYKILEVGNILQRKNHADNSIITSERIQHFHMRVAIQAVACPENPRLVRKQGLPVESYVREFTPEEKQKLLDTYWALSEKYYINSTATGFNSGSIRPQLSACYLTTQRKDSLKGINEWFSDYSFMAKFSGGVGSSIHQLRCTNSYISKTNGYSSNGIKSWMSIAAKYAKSVDQGGGKRPGSHAIYLEPWHGDIETFISMADKLNDNYEPNIKIAIWMCDEFMRCVIKEIEVEQKTGQAPKLWYLMDPNISTGLNNVYDDIHITSYISDTELTAIADRMKFTALYRKYIAEGKYVKQVSASSIFRNIIIRQIEGGTPYVASKDSINRKTNQNDATHQCSNLCVEINEVVSDKETAVCNLANLNLPRFFDPNATDKDLPINWDVMEKVIRIAVMNLNRLIDVSFYPIKKAEYSNKKRRPMGLGVQGMADLHVLCGFPYDSPQAEHLEFKLLEFMYMIALDQSAELAKLYGTYENYAENRISKGLLQHDLWLQEYNESVNSKKTNPLPYPLHSRWDAVRAKIAEYGQRNSLLIALMPTASTYMITGSSPCFEPFNGMVYKRRAKSGEIIIVNKSLIRKLQAMGIWSPKIKTEILASRTGSIAEITEIPAEIRALYKTVWDISPKVTASRAILRGVFVDQSQSLNLFIASPSIKVLSQYHLYQFSRSAKTYSYYTRSLSSTDANKIEAQTEPAASAVTIGNTGNTAKQVVCTDDVCVVCQ